MRISFFGRLADLHGDRICEIEELPPNGEVLRTIIAENHPALIEILRHSGTRLIINDEIVDWDSTLSANDDIAIIPVVSGG